MATETMVSFTQAELETITNALFRESCPDPAKAGQYLDDAMKLLGVASMYTCASCHGTTPKRWWGPGWVTCPRCGSREVPTTYTGFPCTVAP